MSIIKENTNLKDDNSFYKFDETNNSILKYVKIENDNI